MGEYRKLEAYQLARVLLAAVYADTLAAADETANDSREQLRHAALAAALQLVELERRPDPREHDRRLRRSLQTLVQVASLIHSCRRQGVLSADAAGELLAVQARTATALESALSG